MKALVTGGRGFIGSHLLDVLRLRGYRLRTLDRAGAARAVHPDVESFFGDILDARAVAEAVAGCDVVYHLAARTTASNASRADTRATNLAGTVQVAEAARAAGVKRLVFCSTAGVYGIPQPIPCPETAPQRPNTPYRQSKQEAERFLLRRWKEDGLPVVIARPAAVGGTRGANWFGLWRAVARGGFRMIACRGRRLHLSHVLDVAEGLRRCGETEGIEGEAFNLVGKAPVATDQFLAEIATRLGVTLAHPPMPAWPFRRYVLLDALFFRCTGRQLPRAHTYEMFVTDRVFDIGKARRMLGYAPTRTLEQTLNDIHCAYHERVATAGPMGKTRRP